MGFVQKQKETFDKIVDDMEEIGGKNLISKLDQYKEAVNETFLNGEFDIWGNKTSSIEFRQYDFSVFASDSNVHVIRAWFDDIKLLEPFASGFCSAKECGKDVLVFCNSKNKESSNNFVDVMKKDGILRFKTCNETLPYIIAFGDKHRMVAGEKDKDLTIISCHRDKGVESDNLMATFAMMRVMKDE